MLQKIIARITIGPNDCRLPSMKDFESCDCSPVNKNRLYKQNQKQWCTSWLQTVQKDRITITELLPMQCDPEIIICTFVQPTATSYQSCAVTNIQCKQSMSLGSYTRVHTKTKHKSKKTIVITDLTNCFHYWQFIMNNYMALQSIELLPHLASFVNKTLAQQLKRSNQLSEKISVSVKSIQNNCFCSCFTMFDSSDKLYQNNLQEIRHHSAKWS